MKPFNLEAAKAGDPIVCRDGTPVEFVTHVEGAANGCSVVVKVNNYVSVFYENGKLFKNSVDSHSDLLMAPKKHTVWVNMYGSHATVYCSEQDADKAANPHRIGNRAYPVEIEE